MVISIKPLITERTSALASKNWYTFSAPVGVNKNQLKKMVAESFKVEVTQVRTAVVKGKTKRLVRTRKTRRTADWKKVIVKVKEGQKIDLFATGGTEK